MFSFSICLSLPLLLSLSGSATTISDKYNQALGHAISNKRFSPGFESIQFS